MPPRKQKNDQPEAEDQQAAGPEDQHEPAADGNGDGGGVTLGALDARLDRLEDAISRFLKGSPTGQRQTQADQAEDVAAQVRQEVEKIRAADKQTEAGENRIKTLEKKLKELEEVPPREYRRITTILWGDPDE